MEGGPNDASQGSPGGQHRPGGVALGATPCPGPAAGSGGPGPAAAGYPRRGAAGRADGRKLSARARACAGSGWSVTQSCSAQKSGFICIPPGQRGVPPFLRPPGGPSHRGTENIFGLVADGIYFYSLRRSDTYTAMLSPYRGLRRNAPRPSQSTFVAWTWLALGGEGGGEKNEFFCLISFI